MGGKKSPFNTSAKEKAELRCCDSQLFSPVYLALLDDHLVGFLPHDATMKPHLCPVDHWETQNPVLSW